MDIIRDSIKYAKSLGFEDVIVSVEQSSVHYLKIAAVYVAGARLRCLPAEDPV